MEILSLKEIAKAVAGKIINEESLNITNISIDTRTLESGDLFIAIVGDNFDGHDFLNEAFAKGAKAAVVSKDKEYNIDKPLIKVEDTTIALQELAHYYRNKFNIPVVAITGSTGKTTTKDMVASVLNIKYKTLKTEGNFNNEIGLPLTLFRLDSSYEVAVLEMGMRDLGEIERLAQIAAPNIGIITNVGITHIEILKTVDRIAQAKSELISSLPDNGIAILNGDDKRVKKMEEFCSGRVINYGLEDYNEVKATNIKSLEGEEVTFESLISNNPSDIKIKLPVAGEYNVYNALAAISTGLVLNLSLEEIKEGLANLKLTEMRNQILTSKSGFKIINDTYNANPTSMKAALNTLVEVADGGKIAVLGDMLELGTIAKEEHNKLGKLIAQKNIDYLITFGDLGLEIAQGAQKAGMNIDRVFSYQTRDEVIEKLLQVITSDDTILVKGSRGMKLEEVSQALQDK